eukprot:TRINITY_DN15201_c0_g1_i1.p1 TRINITY_DN15201_c0_g1~~TRINITY_DN15201_c0_g1_i1.p1  ORF type:complete len:581 (-),score=114.67 TRINITY_DN15201_c0_g1_i1:111-1853(-)
MDATQEALLHQIQNLTSRIDELSFMVYNLNNDVQQLEAIQFVDIQNLNMAWILLCSFLVFFMQTGFMMLETGGVSRKVLYESIILKNMVNSSIAAVIFYLVGYGFAFGTGGASPRFIGASYFALSGDPQMHNFFWQWTFLSTCATIPSGAMAERTRLRSHCYWVVLCSFLVYPLCAHWVWSPTGWLSASLPESQILMANGVFDFAGSGVVHLVGGAAGFVGAIIAGKRVGRFEDIFERKKVFLPQNIGEMSLGTFILWFSWYGFNCGSTVYLNNGRSVIASRVAVTTTIAASISGIVALLIFKVRHKSWSLPTFLNGVLAGLVSITGGCAYVDPWAALIIGFISGNLYYWFAILERHLEIDDVIEVGPVHLVSGIWGLIAIGLFATQENIFILHGRNQHYGLFLGGGGMQLAIQLIAVVVILSWSLFWSIILFVLLRAGNQLRIDAAWERKALDEDLVEIDVKATLQLMAHNYDIDHTYVRNIDSDKSFENPVPGMDLPLPPEVTKRHIPRRAPKNENNEGADPSALNNRTTTIRSFSLPPRAIASNSSNSRVTSSKKEEKEKDTSTESQELEEQSPDSS